MTNITLISNYPCCVDQNLEFCCFSSNLSAIIVLNISQMEPFPSRLAFLPKTILADLSACLFGMDSVEGSSCTILLHTSYLEETIIRF